MKRRATKPGRAEVASCRCGTVAIEMIGEPIVGASCYCTSCQQAGRQFEAEFASGHVLDPDSGTRYVLHRKDRLRFTRGLENLQEHRLDPASVTRRVVAICCDTPMFLDMTKGHWLSVYAERLRPGAAALDMRVMLKDKPAGTAVATDVPGYQGHNGKFFWRLLVAWVLMGFRSPRVPS